ncbi:MAG: S8 family serine peptidase [Candidatus Helarchaeota archaeon]
MVCTKQGISIFILFFVLFTPFFIFFENDTDSLSLYPPLPFQNVNYFQNSAPILTTSAISVNANQKISPKFQDLLNTNESNQNITCIVVINDQPSVSIAKRLKATLHLQDRFKLRKAIFSEIHDTVTLSQEAMSASISLLGGIILRQFNILNALLVEIPLDTLPKLAAMSAVARIEPDYELHIQLDYSQPIVLNTSPPGWNYSYNGSGVVVAICDTGIDKTHPNLAGRVKYEETFIGGTPDDINGHGTHVAGIIASNDSTYHGIASGVDLINVKVMSSAGTGQTSDLVEGIEWLFNESARNPDVINLSAGTTELIADGDSFLAKFVDAVVSQFGVIWVNAAGNSGSGGLEVPGDSINCISVANFEDHNNLNPTSWTIASSSSRGPTIDGRKKPDIAAPGTNIYSCNANWEGPSPNFVTKTGTSMAAPHVAGAAALLWEYLMVNNASLDSRWYALTIKTILLHTAYDLGTAGYDYAYGWGAVDMGAVWNFLHTGSFEVINMTNSYGIYKYKISLDTPQNFTATVVWNRYSTTNYTHTQYWTPANIDLYLTNEDGIPIASVTGRGDNVKHLTHFTSNGTYYLIVGISSFTNDFQEVVVATDASLRLVASFKIFSPWEILFALSIISIIVIAVAYISLWLKERKEKTLEAESPDASSAWPEWPSTPPI